MPCQRHGTTYSEQFNDTDKSLSVVTCCRHWLSTSVDPRVKLYRTTPHRVSTFTTTLPPPALHTTLVCSQNNNELEIMWCVVVFYCSITYPHTLMCFWQCRRSLIVPVAFPSLPKIQRINSKPAYDRQRRS